MEGARKIVRYPVEETAAKSKRVCELRNPEIFLRFL